MARLSFQKERKNKESDARTALSRGKHELHADRNARIAARAFELYEQRGRKQGNDVQDWLQAEKELFESH